MHYRRVQTCPHLSLTRRRQSQCLSKLRLCPPAAHDSLCDTCTVAYMLTMRSAASRSKQNGKDTFKARNHMISAPTSTSKAVPAAVAFMSDLSPHANDCWHVFREMRRSDQFACSMYFSIGFTYQYLMSGLYCTGTTTPARSSLRSPAAPSARSGASS